jgi:glycosyltransferase involved in cell wall biosynthesis
VLYGSLELNAEIATIAPNLRLAILSRPYVAPRYLHMVRRLAPATRIVYDSVDLHYVRERRQAELAGQTDFRIADSFREIEHGIMRAVDVTAVVTEEERVEIERSIDGVEVVVIPNANPIAERPSAPDGRTGLLFVGGFEHTPNIDAAQWLVEAIMPRVWRELGDVPVAIVGADPPPEVLALESSDVLILGWVKDIDPLIESARINVAPLRFGAGMKGKVSQSLAVGLPVVTTSIGAEGLGAEDGRDLLSADDADGFAERVVSLYRDDARWTRLSVAGQSLAEQVCSPALLRERLRGLLD